MAEPVYATYIAEFIGTFLLVFTVGCNVIAGSGTWAATSIAAVLMVSIYALGGVSGANFNPAVSLALALTNQLKGPGGMTWKTMGIYCAVQIVGGILAGLTYVLMLNKSVNVAPKPGFGWWEAMLAEVLYTFMLCFVVLNSAVSVKNGCASGKQFYGIAIGFVIIAGGYGAGAISGGCFNPAVAIGLDVSSMFVGFGWCLAYTVYEFIGAAMAVGLFFAVRRDEFRQQHVKQLWEECLSEFLGTFMLVLTVGLNVLGNSPAAAWSIAAALMCMIFSLGDVSGAHFNPAVTVAILLAGRNKCEAKKAGAFIGSQLLAGILAAFLYSAMHHGETFALGPVKPYGWAAALAGETVFTFVLCFVVLCVATVESSPLQHYFGFAIGSCVTAGGLAIGGVSGGSLNPAVSVGISASRIMGGGYFWRCLVYSLFEVIGAAVAAGIFRVTHPLEYSKSLLPFIGAAPVNYGVKA